MHESHKSNYRDSSDKSDVGEAIKRVRGLYYKNMIAASSKGKSGERVTFDVLSDEDLDSFRLLNSKGGDIVSAEIKKFIEEILSKEKNK